MNHFMVSLYFPFTGAYSQRNPKFIPRRTIAFKPLAYHLAQKFILEFTSYKFTLAFYIPYFTYFIQYILLLHPIYLLDSLSSSWHAKYSKILFRGRISKKLIKLNLWAPHLHRLVSRPGRASATCSHGHICLKNLHKQQTLTTFG